MRTPLKQVIQIPSGFQPNGFLLVPDGRFTFKRFVFSNPIFSVALKTTGLSKVKATERKGSNPPSRFLKI